MNATNNVGKAASLQHNGLPVYSFATKDLFYQWLGEHYAQDSGFWLRYYKKNSVQQTIAHTDAVDVALCWGWIDGLINKYDAESYVVRYTPRKPKSIWSKANVARVERLTSAGLMQPSGLRQVALAQSDGRWDNAYAGQSNMDIPDEFKTMLRAHPKALAFYESLDKTNKYAIAFRIATIADADKRRQKMDKILGMLLERKTFH